MEADLGPMIPGLPELYGRGPFPYSLVDEVVVPKDLTPGEYVLSWYGDAYVIVLCDWIPIH
jgi:hypothetical protein